MDENSSQWSDGPIFMEMQTSQKWFETTTKKLHPGGESRILVTVGTYMWGQKYQKEKREKIYQQNLTCTHLITCHGIRRQHGLGFIWSHLIGMFQIKYQEWHGLHHTSFCSHVVLSWLPFPGDKVITKMLYQSPLKSLWISWGQEYPNNRTLT